jgi:hypothetical protein
MTARKTLRKTPPAAAPSADGKAGAARDGGTTKSWKPRRKRRPPFIL